ncbi:MAG: hypothetical protein JW770_03200 [Actinobacteria bacterium]|nr:hypothetical protein [Actinomycetota bacterium]
MPEESVAAYINNIITFLIFIIIIAFIFLIFIVISGLYRSSLSFKNNSGHGAGFRKWFAIWKDPFLKKNLFITGITFIFTGFIILLVFAVMDYSNIISLNLILFTIGLAVFFIIVMLVYIVKSKIIK